MAGASSGGGRDVEILVLGAGVCGVAAGVGLGRAGYDDVVIVERDESIGGTWYHNAYPGCAVDIPSHVYCFSYALNPNWSRVYATHAELKQYVGKVADDYGVRDKVLLNTEVLEARWDGDDQRWHIETNRGAYRARFFVIAPGPLHEPSVPDLPGRDTFQGEAFHSSRWPDGLDLTGREVVAIGTGASAIQFVPAIQPQVRKLTLLQRTPAWVFPKPDWDISEKSKRRLARFPVLMKAIRFGTWLFLDVFTTAALRSPRFARAVSVVGRLHIRKCIKDVATRKALTPKYAVACKRLGFSNDYYPALAQSNIELVTSPAVEVRERSVITADGREIPADTIIFGTGFHTMQHHPVAERIRGRSGETLAEVWKGDPKAHMGTTMHGFPNAFMMFGPNAGTLSGFTMAESQTNYIIGAIQEADRLGAAALDVTATAQERFVAETDRKLSGSTLLHGGCNSYYLADGNQRVALAWPGTMYGQSRRLRKFDGESYETVGRLSSGSRELCWPGQIPLTK